MSKARPSTAAPTPTLLEQAQALRAQGDVFSARKLAHRMVEAGGADADAARHLLTLTTAPRWVYAYAGIAAAILTSLVTLASLRS